MLSRRSHRKNAQCETPESSARSDRRELEVAAHEEVDFVAASFVRDGEFVNEISRTLAELGADIPVIAKIERDVTVENIDSIIDAAYGVVVARGDLGVETPLENVPMAQKRIIRKCNDASVPVITATEMLDSMTTARRPTRAESSDVANAVLDGTDAVMLSGETAMDDHPVRVVETMDRLVRDVEDSPEYDQHLEGRVPDADGSATDALSLSWGIAPASASYTPEGVGAVIRNAVQSAVDVDAAEEGDTVVALSGMMTELEAVNTSNMLRIHTVSGAARPGARQGGGTHPTNRVLRQ